MTPGTIALKIRMLVNLCRCVVSSVIGMRIALQYAATQEPKTWREDFAGRRVLIIGTGPSLDHVTEDYFAGFDVLICINHAILRTPAHPCIYYVSTDVPRTQEVMNTEAAARISAIEISKRILFLSFVLTAPYLLSDLFKRFTVVRYRAYYLHRWGTGRLSRRYYQPRVASNSEIENWIKGRSGFLEMPSRGGSSAFSAILLAARYHPKEIRLIGVDLSDGRSSALQDVAGASAAFGGYAPDRYLRLERIVRDCGVPVENDSWTVMPNRNSAT